MGNQTRARRGTRTALVAALLSVIASPGTATATSTLRVCADPNNLPFSNARGEGFENKLADLLASEMNADVEYVWWAQRRGFLRNTLNAGRCDVVIGVPAELDLVITTRPYYRSTYVFVSRATPESPARLVASFDDPALRRLKVGVHVIGDDGASTPPLHALARRNIIDTVVGFTIYGDYREENPPASLIHAVARGDVDVAVAWGPLAGFFSKRSAVPLSVIPVSPAWDGGLPFVYDIAVGVRRNDEKLRDEIDRILVKRKADIERLLDAYGVPRVKP